MEEFGNADVSTFFHVFNASFFLPLLYCSIPTSINVSRLAKGVYLMKINNGTNGITAKFVKE